VDFSLARDGGFGGRTITGQAVGSVDSNGTIGGYEDEAIDLATLERTPCTPCIRIVSRPEPAA
jgi:hypothetical protein